MESISAEELDRAMKMAPERVKEEKKITEDQFFEMLKDMQNPVNSQKEIAVKIKVFLDKRIEDEMDKNGVLGDNTRKWIETYTTLLEKLQRAIHGDKSLNLHVHEITHGDVAAKIRESSEKVFVIKEQGEKKKNKESR